MPARTVKIGDLLDTFLVCAVTMILVIRLQLWVTNYPQLGGGKLHIAHLLWGGMLMLIALVLLLSFVLSSLRITGAVIGGLGFGFFIDELGKFITEDNDYFFKPTAALIYIVFILLYFGTRTLLRERGFTPQEYLANAIDLIKDGAVRGLDEPDKRRALDYLDHADQSDRMVGTVRKLVSEADLIPTQEPRWPVRAARRLHGSYVGLIDRSWFPRAMSAVFIAWAVLSLLQILGLVFATALEGDGIKVALNEVGSDVEKLTFVNVATIASSLVAGAFMIAGVYKLRSSRLAAYRMFDRGLLVEIFVTQVFTFIESQFSAVFGLLINLALLATLRYMMREETDLELREHGRSA